LAACQRKRLRFLRFSFTQRTQRKRLRLNGNRALAYVINSRVLSSLERRSLHSQLISCDTRQVGLRGT